MRATPRTYRHPYRGTTRHVQSAFPFMADAGLGSDGVIIGRDGLRRTFCYDPFVLYQKGRLNGPNMLVLGDIGYGKSALTKSYLYRQAVFGYTAANDVSARDLQFSDQQWVRGKSLDTFCPLGPVVVTPDDFGDPQDKRLLARVNGETMQDSTTGEMIFGVAEIVSFLSHACTLEPGDLILTGTPWGVGGFRDPPIFLAPGDSVEIEVEGVGVLNNEVGRNTT